MKSKEIRYEVVFNKTKKLVISMNKEDLLIDYKQYVRIKEAMRLDKPVSLRKYVLYRFQKIIEVTFIKI